VKLTVSTWASLPHGLRHGVSVAGMRGWPIGVAVAAVAVGIAVPAVAGAGPQHARATTTTVNAGGALGLRFSPATAKIAQGDSVKWHFNAAGHTTTDSSAMGLWDSGVSTLGEEFTHTFPAAGTYHYQCSIHVSLGMTGIVKVPVLATPKAGGTSTAVTVRWSSAAPAAGFAFDVQARGPGDPGFHTFKSLKHTTAQSTTGALGTAGTWTFRARLVKLAGGQSGWSPAANVTLS
jgi:plastocyanin